MTIYDLTHTIRNDMPVYPGTEQPRLTTACTIEEAAIGRRCCNVLPHGTPPGRPGPHAP